jgi:uncharacterized iron-regulated membrane protein
MSVSHLWLGLLSSIVIFIVCLTGSLYAFKQQIEDVVNQENLTVSRTGIEKKPIDSLLNHFENQFGKATQLFIFPEANRSILISSFTKDNPGISVYYDPYSGKQLGVKSAASEKFFSIVLDLHRFLLAGDMGKTIVGIAVLMFVYMLFSGFILWLPKKWKQLKNGFSIKWRARFYRLNYDLHKVLGFYALLLLLFIAITGLYVSFHWMKNAIIVGLGGDSIIISETNTALKKELSQSFKNLLGDLETESHVPITKEEFSIQGLISTADSVFQYSGIQQWQLPNEQINIFQLTKMNTQNVMGFVVPDRMEFSATGKIRKTIVFKNLLLHEQFKAIAKPLHTGEIIGLPSIILYFFTSLIGCSLPVTGFIIWLKRN